MSALRLFIAVEIPPDIRSSMQGIISMLKQEHADVCWETWEKLHMTLKFLGKTEDRLVPALVESLETQVAEVSGFSLRYAGLGCFPHTREPRIIWVGADSAGGSLQCLAAAIDGATSALGFPAETRTFHAHVTIGRVKTQRGMKGLLRKMESITFESQPTTISDVALVKSDLTPNGSVYTILQRIPLHQQQV